MDNPIYNGPLAYDVEDEYRPEEPRPLKPAAWMDGSIRIGIHTSIAGDIAQSLEIAHWLGANAVQIFSASPRMWHVGGAGTLPAASRPGRERFSAAETDRFRARREELGLGPLVVHANYLINLASADRVLRVRSIQAFHDELVRAIALGADYLVVHPGSGRGIEHRQALDLVAQALRQSVRGLHLGTLRILVENTAGQGASLGTTFSELKTILEASPGLPLGICVDTAHLFAAGFNIRDPGGLERTLLAIESTVGLSRVFIIHCNDSKTPLGSRVDRHEHIGKGKIGLEAFRRILNHPLLAPVAAVTSGEQISSGVGRAFILETPIDKPGDDLRNVRALWRLVGKKVPRAAVSPGGVPRDGFRAGSRVVPADSAPQKSLSRQKGLKVKGRNPIRKKER